MPLPRTITHLLPTGAIVMYSGSDIPSGYLLCNGASVSRSDYPDLAAALGETGSTFSLPDYRDRVPQGAGTVSPNVGVEASLPDVSGRVVVRYGDMDGSSVVWNGTGAFTISSVTTGTAGTVVISSETRAYANIVDFYASTSDSIYSGTAVQPPAWATHFLIKI